MSLNQHQPTSPKFGIAFASEPTWALPWPGRARQRLGSTGSTAWSFGHTLYAETDRFFCHEAGPREPSTPWVRSSQVSQKEIWDMKKENHRTYRTEGTAGKVQLAKMMEDI